MGSLLVGYYEDKRLVFAGRVGTGFSSRFAQELYARLSAMERPTSPFNPPPEAAMAKGAYYVSPTLVCDVSFTEWTGDDRIRHPAFLGLREDVKPKSRHAAARLTNPARTKCGRPALAMQASPPAGFHAPARARNVQTRAARADTVDVLSSIVLIAEPEQLDVLRQRPDFAGALAFTDSETPTALEAILIHRPPRGGHRAGVRRQVARRRADQPHQGRPDARGAARFASSRTTAAFTPRGRAARAPRRAAGTGGGTAVAAVAAPPVALDQKGTRRAQRYKIIAGIEVLIDGNPALLVDLSVVGAQVVSDTLLKPNQRVRLSFIESARRCASAPAWPGPRSSCRRASRATARASSSSTRIPTPSRASATRIAATGEAVLGRLGCPG